MTTETTPTTPIEARCDHCTQTRPLFLYEPNHTFHLIPVHCEWCQRDTQPLLCARCWEKERLREENAPTGSDEQAARSFLGEMLRANARYAAQAEADKAMCDGIAAATKQHTPSDPPAG